MRIFPAGYAMFLLAGVLCVTLPAFARETICLEAEWAESMTAPVEKVDATDDAVARGVAGATEASGRQYIQIAQGKGNPPEVTTGEARYVFEVRQGGTFILWCRVWWDDECGNSFTMSLNNNKPFMFGRNASFKRWHWVKSAPRLKQLELAPGQNTLLIRNREDGVRLDQILLTTDARFVPVGIEATTPDARVTPSDPPAEASEASAADAPVEAALEPAP